MKCRNSSMCVYASVHTFHFFFLCCFSWYTRGSGKKVIQSSKKNHCGVDVLSYIVIQYTKICSGSAK